MTKRTFWEQIKYYFFIGKKKTDKTEKKDINLRMMHGMNRLSIYLFLFALMIILYRAFIKH